MWWKDPAGLAFDSASPDGPPHPITVDLFDDISTPVLNMRRMKGMIGAVIRSELFSMAFYAAGSRERAASIGKPPCVVGAQTRRPLALSEARRLLAVVVLFTFGLGALVNGPAAHSWAEGGWSTTTQPLGVVAKASRQTNQIPEQRVPQCTGHCAAHAVSLPVLSSQSVEPIVNRTPWRVIDDQQPQNSVAARLERPPRS